MSANESAATTIVRRAERRTKFRRPGQLPITVETLDMASNSPWLGWTHDISAQGISLTLARRFEPGAILALTFLEGTDCPLTVLGRVVRTIRVASGGWLLGCRLPQEVDPEEFGILLEKLSAAVASPAVARSETSSTAQHLDVRKLREKLQQITLSRTNKGATSGEGSGG